MTPLKIGFPVNVTNDTSVGLNSQFPMPPHRGEENGMDEVESGLTSSRRYSPTSLSRPENKLCVSTRLVYDQGTVEAAYAW